MGLLLCFIPRLFDVTRGLLIFNYTTKTLSMFYAIYLHMTFIPFLDALAYNASGVLQPTQVSTSIGIERAETQG